MTQLANFSYSELIDYTYTELAGLRIRDNMVDWDDYQKWRQIVHHMPYPVQLVYRIGILNNQVINGGFIQYFDNGYGIFALDTLIDLKTVKADLTYELLEKCLTLINPGNYKNEAFYRYMHHREFATFSENSDIELEAIDKLYWNLDDKENLELLIGDYLRQHLDELE